MAYYQFSLPMTVDEAYSLVREICKKKGTIKRDVPGVSIEIKTKSIGLSSSLPFSFFLKPGENETEVIVSYNPPKFVVTSKTEAGENVWDVPDRVWSHIIQAFCEAYPTFPLRSGKPVVVAAVPCDDGLAQEAVSCGKNVSLGRAAVGGALFGSAGAILGGLSGTKQNKTQTRKVFSTTALFRVLYSNGRVVERTVKKNSREYAELVARSI